MPSVYDKDAFSYRVQFAANVISKGGSTTRTFDSCFEMNDGDEVAAALIRRVKANPDSQLAKNLSRYICVESATDEYESTKHLSLKELKQQAADSRARARVEFEAMMVRLRAKQEDNHAS